jgi:predicted transglutaminase-like cysteine proteinase
LGDGVVFQKKTLRELLLAAGLWLTASACLAAPQPGQSMRLGASAMPPQAYLAFCARRPADCGSDAGQVLAGVVQAENERIALFAAMSPAQLTTAAIAAPAAVASPAGLVKASWSVAPATERQLAPAPQPLEAVIVRVDTLTKVDFVDPVAEARAVFNVGPPAMTPELWSKLNRINDHVNRALIQRTDMDNYGQADYWATPLEDGRNSGDCEDYVLEKQRALILAGVPRSALNIALVTTTWGESHAVLLVSTREGDYVLDNLSRWVTPWERAPYRWRQREVNGDPFTWAMIQDPSKVTPQQIEPPRDERQPATKGLLLASLR